MISDSLHLMLRQLRLSSIINTFPVRLQEAEDNSLSHQQFLELILQNEVILRGQRQIKRGARAASICHLYTRNQFDFNFNKVDRQLVYQLPTCQFVRDSRDLLLLSPPGIGKSNPAQAIGLQIIRQGLPVLYRDIFNIVRDFMKKSLRYCAIPQSRPLTKGGHMSNQ